MIFQLSRRSIFSKNNIETQILILTSFTDNSDLNDSILQLINTLNINY